MPAGHVHASSCSRIVRSRVSCEAEEAAGTSPRVRRRVDEDATVVVEELSAWLDREAGPPSASTLAELRPIYRNAALWELDFWEMLERPEVASAGGPIMTGPGLSKRGCKNGKRISLRVDAVPPLRA
jgi:hypothetical protein